MELLSHLWSLTRGLHFSAHSQGPWILSLLCHDNVQRTQAQRIRGLRALLVCCDQTGGKGEGGWRRASPILWMRPRSMPESGAWEHSLLVADGPKKRGLLSVCGSGRDDIGSGVSMDDNLSLQLCDEPRPGAVFF